MSEFLSGFGNDYNEVEAYSGGSKPEALEPNGYVLRIIGCKTQTARTGATKLMFAFEIAEGEKKGYFKALHEYQKQFDTNAKWQGTYDFFYPTKGNGSPEDIKKYKKSLAMLKSVVTAINESNPHSAPIDVTKQFTVDAFKGKLVGGIFGLVEWNYNGKSGMKARCRWFTDVAKVRSGDFTIPDPKYSAGSQQSAPQNPLAGMNVSDFEEIISDGDVPF